MNECWNINKNMGVLQKKIRDFALEERARWILWVPVLYGTGVGIYFLLPEEPSLQWLVVGCTVLALTAALLRWKQKKGPSLFLLCLLMVVSGMAMATWRTIEVAAPILNRTLLPQEVTGRIVEITTRPETSRLTLENVHIQYLDQNETPERVTVSLREHVSAELAIGDKVRLRVGFFPPPKPTMPGAFPFNRHLYFKRIGATGFAPYGESIAVLEKAVESDGWMAGIARLRQDINDRMLREMGPREGSIAGALMTGEMRAIPEDISEAMRVAGLTHVLAVSGMHLALVAGIVFFAARFALACIPAFAIRFDPKKTAALVALPIVGFYLLLAGNPVSAQRAYVMTALVLLAVMMDRQVTPMRSLALAAMVILLLTPEAVLSPGFQLSFAATMGILAYYEHWQDGKRPVEEWTWKKRFWRFWSGIIITSTVATLTTAPFVLHHFEGFPTYSLIGNLLVLPLVSFWIMPVIVVMMLLMPFGLYHWLTPLLAWGIKAMIAVAIWVAQLPYAAAELPPLHITGLVVMTLGGLWFCIWRGKWRHIGWVPVVAGLMMLPFHQPPDMVISPDGKKIAVRTAQETVAMLRGNRNGFVQDGWKRFSGVKEFALRREAAAETLRCDGMGCIWHWNGKTVAVSYHRAALAEDCEVADTLIAPDWPVYGRQHGNCAGKQVFDSRFLAGSHGVALWVDENGMRYDTVKRVLGNRPWSN